MIVIFVLSLLVLVPIGLQHFFTDGVSKNSQTNSQTSKEIVSNVAQLSNIDLCRAALNAPATDWVLHEYYRQHIAEAKRRGLSIEDCQRNLGMLPKSQEIQPALIQLTNNDLCRGALDGPGEKWDSGSTYQQYVAEAKRRNLSIQDCQRTLGLLRKRKKFSHKKAHGTRLRFQHQIIAWRSSARKI
ncbi:MAG: hypothetical protein IPK23_09300 [Rhizobiales bacterium]|nr:hypothetical protein [Hyphomicrobiales bacterium]